jgi:NAD(P)-dependent dehydrogenase (short-subunit alcohol dehydrogenase family)
MPVPKPSRRRRNWSPQLAGRGIAVQVDHLIADDVRKLVDRIRAEQGRLDVLVNDIWGGEKLFEWDKPVWDHNLQNGLRMLRLGIDTHLITAHYALPMLIGRPGGLLVEVTDGTAEYNAEHYRLSPFYDLAKVAVTRMAWAHAKDLAPHGATSVSLTPGWLRSEMMLEAFGVSEENWRDATAKVPHFVISETPRFVGRAVAALAADPDRARWNGQSLSSGGLAQVALPISTVPAPMPGAMSRKCRTPESRPTRPAIGRPRKGRDFTLPRRRLTSGNLVSISPLTLGPRVRRSSDCAKTGRRSSCSQK